MKCPKGSHPCPYSSISFDECCDENDHPIKRKHSDNDCDLMLPFHLIEVAHNNAPRDSTPCQALTAFCEAFHPSDADRCVKASSTPSCHSPTDKHSHATCKYDLQSGREGFRLKTWAMDKHMEFLNKEAHGGKSHYSDYHPKPQPRGHYGAPD